MKFAVTPSLFPRALPGDRGEPLVRRRRGREPGAGADLALQHLHLVLREDDGGRAAGLVPLQGEGEAHGRGPHEEGAARGVLRGLGGGRAGPARLGPPRGAASGDVAGDVLEEVLRELAHLGPLQLRLLAVVVQEREALDQLLEQGNCRMTLRHPWNPSFSKTTNEQKPQPP